MTTMSLSPYCSLFLYCIFLCFLPMWRINVFIARVHSVRVMNVEQRQAADDSQTKPPDLGCESACYAELSSTTTNAICYYYSARNTHLPSHVIPREWMTDAYTEHNIIFSIKKNLKNCYTHVAEWRDRSEGDSARTTDTVDHTEPTVRGDTSRRAADWWTGTGNTCRYRRPSPSHRGAHWPTSTDRRTPGRRPALLRTGSGWRWWGHSAPLRTTTTRNANQDSE